MEGCRLQVKVRILHYCFVDFKIVFETIQVSFGVYNGRDKKNHKRIEQVWQDYISKLDIG